MIRIVIKVLLFIVLVSTNRALSQEWNSLKSYQAETKETVLQQGCWLRKDRTNCTVTWCEANKYNLNAENGSGKYKTICQKRDFYKWFDAERKRKGHEIKWIGYAVIAANQLSMLDNGFICFFLVRDHEVVNFANEGAEKVFTFAFSQLKPIYFSNEIIIGKDAENWDVNYGTTEQCVILEPLYQHLSPKASRKLERMAKGKGIYRLGVPEKIKYEGDIDDCNARFLHGIHKLQTYYDISLCQKFDLRPVTR